MHRWRGHYIAPVSADVYRDAGNPTDADAILDVSPGMSEIEMESPTTGLHDTGITRKAVVDDELNWIGHRSIEVHHDESADPSADEGDVRVGKGVPPGFDL
jgi:hypothetical protein